LALWFVAMATGQALSIYELQYTVDPSGASPHDGQVVDCAGGVCVAKFAGSRPRLILQDPAYPDGWGGIQVKDWIYPYDLFNQVQIGDWVELSNMLVEEYRGTTFLHRQAAYNPGYLIVSQHNPLPALLEVSVGAIAAPVFDPNNPNGPGWYVADHRAEPYESMRLLVRDLSVTEMDLGKALDNYRLRDGGGQDCWASDYMNQDVGEWGYHPLVEVGRHFCAVSGVLEQYTKLNEQWDYYQLVTTLSADMGLRGDLNCDCNVDGFDIQAFVLALTDAAAYYAAQPDCNRGLADVNSDGVIDGFDIAPFVQLLTGR